MSARVQNDGLGTDWDTAKYRTDLEAGLVLDNLAVEDTL